MTRKGQAKARTSIEVTCNEGHSFRVKRKYAGRRGKCPECAASVFVPRADETQDVAGDVLETRVKKESDTGIASESEESAAGQQLGRFHIERVLGEGAFGTVYLADDPQLDRQVALKIPKLGALGGKKEVHRFLREARAAAQLRHPNIVPIYDAGEIDGTYFIASAFVPPGRTLGDWMSEQGQLQLERAARLIGQLASALDYAHSLGIVHRDIKPHNILLDESGAPHIADFGLARREDADALRTQENVRMGTPAYMSPEQHAGKSREADGRSDMWALGVILYEMLTGERPFQGKDVQLMCAVRELEPESPRKKRRSIPRDLETICLKCLAKEPEKRYATCEELAEDLRRWRDRLPIMARRVSVVKRLWRWSKRNPAISGLAAAAVVVATLGAIGILGKWADADVQRVRAEDLATEVDIQRLDAQRQADLAEQNAHRAEKEKAIAEERSARLAETAEALDDKARELQQAINDAENAKKNAEIGASKLLSKKELADAEARRAADTLRSSLAHLYNSNIVLAQRHWSNGNVEAARKYLADCLTEFRDQKWKDLQQKYGSSTTREFPVPAGLVDILLSPDGKKVAGFLNVGNSYLDLTVLDADTGRELLRCKRAGIGGRTGASPSLPPESTSLAATEATEVSQATVVSTRVATAKCTMPKTAH